METRKLEHLLGTLALALVALVLFGLLTQAEARAAPYPVTLSVNPESIAPGQTATVTTTFTNTNPSELSVNATSVITLSYMDNGVQKMAEAVCPLEIRYPGGNPWTDIAVGFQVPLGLAVDTNSISTSGEVVNPKVVMVTPDLLQFTGDSLAPGRSGTLIFKLHSKTAVAP